ncbi:unnamed protein product [Aureobasidium uvarum]|uniref:Uncharacterized protein n=1 Tax=Aureobasidium uvarum TaxID=2773716 RepID=A0A9N8KA12_9PEZI|nr:unnamed protein product [Aureobasidium uvarum]
MTAPAREQFMAGVNSTGPDGRPLPAGAAAAARMTAAEREAARKVDDETFSLASAAMKQAEREEELEKKKQGKGDHKSLIRRLLGSAVERFVAFFKREQHKMN